MKISSLSSLSTKSMPDKFHAPLSIEFFKVGFVKTDFAFNG